MNDDEMVTLEVRMPRWKVDDWAKVGPGGPVSDAAIAWVAANDRPERDVFALDVMGPVGEVTNGWRRAVAVEDLRPGDRVAGLTVKSVDQRTDESPPHFLRVHFESNIYAPYQPGTLVVLDPEGDR